ncbi:M48 family metallopeptidase [Embleya sp. NPDC056575]|uniref:M48 family metallopeptidase n=1 Tax=unclassified Embleya TaxID=2699296 RepID=UPI0036A3AE06
MDPAGAEEPAPGRVEAARRRLAHRDGERLLAEVERGGDARPARDAKRVLTYAVAVPVHATTLVLLVLGVLLPIVAWGTVFGPVLGGLFLAMAWVLRPRLGALPKNAPVLERASAPALFALIDEIATVAGTTGVDAVVIDGRFNAGVTTYGLRQRRMLHLGLGLWEVLTPRQRVAVLGHELGHYAHGDTRRGVVVGSTLRSLRVWYYLLAPSRRPGPGSVVVNSLMFLPRWGVYGVLALLDHLSVGAAQRAEYLADRTAARAGSSAAAVELMDRLLIGASVDAELRRQAVVANTRVGRPVSRAELEAGLWANLAAHVRGIPEREYERLRRVSALRGHRVDATHPPTHLRRQRVRNDEQYPGLVHLDHDRAATIGDELADARRQLAGEALRDTTR